MNLGRRRASTRRAVLHRPALTASAEQVNRKSASELVRLNQGWQAAALGFYDTLGECHYPAQFYSRSFQMIDVFPAVLDEEGNPQQSEDPLLVDLWGQVQDPGGGGIGELKGSYGRLMWLVGDGRLTVTLGEDGEEQWEFLSPLELRILPDGGGFQRFPAPGMDPVTYRESPDGQTLTEGEARVWRLWRKHPTYSQWADSPVRSVIDLYQLLTMLTLAANAQSQSRAANRGAIFMPEEFDFGPQDTDAGDEDPEVDPFIEEFTSGLVTAIKDPGSASAMAPLIIRAKAVLENEARTSSHASKDLMGWIPLGPDNQYTEAEMWEKTIKRIAVGLDWPVELMTGVGQLNHWCQVEDTEILTSAGWRTHEQLAGDEDVLTLNHETGMSEWQHLQTVSRFEVDEDLLSIESRCHSSLSTMNHRWPTVSRVGGYRRWRTSETLREVDHIVTGARCASIPIDPKHPDALVELAAWIWTEGSISYRAGRKNPKVAIHQSHTANPENVASISAALTEMYGPEHDGPLPSSRRSAVLEAPKWRRAVREDRGESVFSLNVAAAKPLVRIAPRKIVALGFIRELTAPQLRLFIRTSLLADGSKTQPVIGQKDGRRLAAIELAHILLGGSVNRYDTIVDGYTEHTMQQLALHKRNRFGPKEKHKRIVHYKGIVWCPTTPNGTWLARRHGHVYYTGNSGWLVDEQAFRQHQGPAMQKFCDDMAAAYLRPAARAAGFGDWENVVLGFDPSKAIVHADETKTARDAFNDGAVSSVYYREKIGANDADAPSEDDIALLLALKGRTAAAEFGPQAEGGAASPDAGGTGADVNEDVPESNGNPVDAVTASALRAARIMGAAELYVERARTLAGSRLISRSKGCADCRTTIANVRPALVASALGSDTVRDVINGHTSEAALVSGAGDELAAALARWVGGDWPREIGKLMENHALRTLYEPEPPALPTGFAAVVAKAVA